MHRPSAVPIRLIFFVLIVCNSFLLYAQDPSDTNTVSAYNVTSSSPPPQNLHNSCMNLLTNGYCQICLAWTDPRKNVNSPLSDEQKTLYSRYFVRGNATNGATFFSQGYIVSQNLILASTNCTILQMGLSASFQVAGSDVDGVNIGQYSNVLSIYCPMTTNGSTVNPPSTNTSITPVTNGITIPKISYMGNGTFMATYKQGVTPTKKVILAARCQDLDERFNKLARSQSTAQGSATSVSLKVVGFDGHLFSCKVTATAFYPNGYTKVYVRNYNVS